MSLSSLDTNVLLYAAKEDCGEHQLCRALLERAVAQADLWIIADQVFLELYKALRNPKVLSVPLTAPDAASHIRTLREELGVMHCCYTPECWTSLVTNLEKADFPYQRTHDAVLAATLIHHGVKTFYTRNTKDFQHVGFDQVINPVDGCN
ncbi:MAG: TA system VapC family ribonuclease toxin [bacterium]